jgi:hypothetical protein
MDDARAAAGHLGPLPKLPDLCMLPKFMVEIPAAQSMILRLRSTRITRGTGHDPAARAFRKRLVGRRMSASPHPEFAPLLAPGRHVFCIPKLRTLCVEEVPFSPTRQVLFAALESWIEAILATGFTADLWVDGSFLTAKVDPNDIDVVTKIDYDVSMSLSHSARQLFQLIGSGQFHQRLDSYVFVSYPVGHPRRRTATDQWDYWSRQWGVGRDEWCKGIAVLRLGETDVGLRLFA